jgi:hypothetical protein
MAAWLVIAGDSFSCIILFYHNFHPKLRYNPGNKQRRNDTG